MHLLCYDIEDNYLRQKIANRLIEIGLVRIQKSVFLGELSNKLAEELETWLKTKVEEKLDNENDIIVAIKLAKNEVREMQCYGVNKPDIDYIVGDKNTMLF